MTVVKKNNVELTIEDCLVDEYLEMGYSVLDDKGNVIRKNMTAAERVVELNNTIEALKSENETLRSNITKLVDEINALKSSHSSSNDDIEDNPQNHTTKKARANKSV
jgi:predicted  nucleic acid-binding Zn-ribbon protein